MRRFFSMIALAALTMGAVNAQTADQIAANYVKAIGGATKWKAVKSSKVDLTLNTQGVDLKGTVISDNKNRNRVEVTLNGANIVQAYDGETVWWINPFQGINSPAKMPEQAAKDMKEQEFLDGLIDYKMRGSTLTLEGEETIESTTCHKLKLVRKSGRESILFIDKETNLLFMTRTKSSAQGFEEILDTFNSGYETVNGLTAPTKRVVKSAGVVQRTFTFDNVEYNVEVTDEIFAYPGN